jgi:hypothetical protein
LGKQMFFHILTNLLYFTESNNRFKSMVQLKVVKKRDQK